VPTAPLEPRTPATVVDPDALALELARVRERGWATAEGDFEAGLNGVAAPILDEAGRCRAALCVSGPAYRLPSEDLPALAERCRAAAARIGGLLVAADVARSA
jgi:IclR family acetate operon transcriptional repressor